jgi:hypothetical protein
MISIFIVAYLNVIIECAIMFLVALQQWICRVLAKVFKLNEHLLAKPGNLKEKMHKLNPILKNFIL